MEGVSVALHSDLHIVVGLAVLSVWHPRPTRLQRQAGASVYLVLMETLKQTETQ